MPDSALEITLAICTCDRRESLSETLDTVAGQQYGFPWEVLVVDNNSADEDLFERVRKRSLRIELLRERARARGKLAQLLGF